MCLLLMGQIRVPTGFYGEPSQENKYKSLEYICELYGRMGIAWLLLGDFNEILCSEEKEGEVPRAQRDTRVFQDYLSSCGLKDLGYTGACFTWSRGKMRGRLD